MVKIKRLKLIRPFFWILILVYIFFSAIIITTTVRATTTVRVTATDESVNKSKENKGKVLFICSHSPSSPIFIEHIKGINSQMDTKKMQLDIEFMDSERLDTPTNINNFYQTLRYKLNYLPKYSAVIISGNQGFEFVLKNKDELFKNIPIISFGIKNKVQYEEYFTDSNIICLEDTSFSVDTINLATKLQTDARKIYGVFENSKQGQLDERDFLNIADQFSQYEFVSLNLKNLSYYGLRKQIENIEKQDTIIYYSAGIDSVNSQMNSLESIQLMNEYTDAPIFSVKYDSFGKGVVGGKMVSFENQAKVATTLVLESIETKTLDDFNRLFENQAFIYLDDEKLEEFSLDKSVIEDYVVLINNKLTFFEEHMKLIIYVGIAFGILLLIIIIMSINVKRRRVAEKALKLKRKQLQLANDNLQDKVYELDNKNNALRQLLGSIESKDEEIKELIYIDNLTGLANRRSITNAIDHYIKDASTKRLDIIFLDVDNFKNINDTFGHDVGDQVIFHTGKRLKRLQNESIQIGRFGGDEFLMVFVNMKSEEKVKRTLEDIQNCFMNLVVIQNKKFNLTVSMGIATYPEHGISQKDLIKKADMALFEAKKGGKNDYIRYNNDMDIEFDDKVEFQQEIKEAFNRSKFYLVYQPYYDLKTNNIRGFEALIRWNSSTFGKVSPFKLITNAEEMGLIIEIGYWILSEAARFAKEINKDSEIKRRVSVNISMVQLMHQGFYNAVINLIEQLRVDPRYLCFEMTETVLLNSVAEGREIIKKFKEYGIAISLDDFGTGYSSLSYFRDIPADIVKIDKSFIDNMTKNDFDISIVEVIIKLAHGKGLYVIAEGVEYKEQVDILRRLNCDVIQGYYFDKPLLRDIAVSRVLEDKISIKKEEFDMVKS